jgi:hypothetical protein
MAEVNSFDKRFPGSRYHPDARWEHLFAPGFSPSRVSVLLSWLEPRAAVGYRFRTALRHGSQWAQPVTIDESSDIVMFSADLPGVARSPGGPLLAYWERADHRAHEDMYATAIQLSRSVDNGRTWTTPVALIQDKATGEHSFVSSFLIGTGIGLLWLDGQKQTHVHTAAVAGKQPKDE